MTSTWFIPNTCTCTDTSTDSYGAPEIDEKNDLELDMLKRRVIALEDRIRWLEEIKDG